MIIFVSDLHLVDHSGRASFKVAPLFEAIVSRLQEPRSVDDPVKLVLLGDIFELLKSGVWLQENIRPWDTPDSKLFEASSKILRGIRDEERNAPFFAQLQRLRSDFGVQLEYLPGNHDGLLEDRNVLGLRALLREMIPGLPGVCDEPFPEALVDEDHGVVAEHGHALDAFNRRSIRSGRFVPGDAVVIELVVGLPNEVAASRKEDQFASGFEYLHEMDNVEPQTLSGLMRWLEYKMEDVSPAAKKAWESDVSTALTVCGRRLRAAMKKHGSQPFGRKVLWAFTFHKALTKISVLRRFAKLPTGTTNEISAVAGRVSVIESTGSRWKVPPDLYVAGHTHVPMRQVFATTSGLQMTYLNTGTWRRVHSPVRSLGRVAFREAYYQSIAYVHRLNLAERYGRYELRSYVRGD